MGAADIDRLEVEIEASAVKANRALDAFISKLEKLSSSVGKINGSDLTGFANGIEKICKASSGMSNIKTSDFTRLSKNIEKIASINTASINATSSALGVMAKQLSSFSAASTNASAISEFAKNISKLGNKGVTSAMANMPKFATAFNQMMTTISKAPQMSKNIIDMTNALANLAQGLKGTQSAASQTGGSASKLSRLLNTLTASTQKSGRSFKSFAQIAGSFYANFFMVARGIQKAWKSVMSSMDYVETFNYWNVAIDKIGTEFGKQFEQYGYDSAEAYANSFAGRLKTLTLKMTGYEIGDVGDLSLTGNKNLGLDPEQLMNYQAKIVSVTNAVGLCGETSTNTAKALSMLAADMSSYTNEDLSSVMTNFQSGLIGQSRALYKFGIDITNATLQQYAYNLGVTKSLSAMTQAEKMQLRLIAILDQSKVAWGDQANTLGSVANQYRITKQQISNLARTIGNLLLPIVKNVLPVVNAMVMALNRLFTTLGFHFFGSNWLKDLQDGTSKGYGTGLEDLGEDADDAADSLGSAANAAKKLKDVTLGIDELNINDPTSGSDSSGSGSGAGGGVDLSGAIADALKDYETVWDKAFAESENKAQKIADAICSAFKRGDYEGIGTYISNGISSALEKINWGSVYGVASNFGTGFAQFLNGLITPRLFGNVGMTIAGALNTAIYTALSFGETFDWNNLGESIASGINDFFSTFDFTSAAETVNTWAKGLFETVKAAVANIDWWEVYSGINDFFKNIDISTVAIVIGALTIKKIGKVVLANGIIKSIGSLIGALIHDVPIAISGIKILSAGGLLKETGIFTKLANAIALAAGGAGTLHESLIAIFGTVSTIIAGVTSVIGGAITAVVNFFAMWKDGFSWLNEILMNVGIAIAAIGAVILGVAAAPAAIAAAVVAAVATIAVVVKEHWTEICDTFSKAGKWFGTNVITPITTFFQNLWENVSGYFNNLWSDISGVWKSVSGWFSDNVIEPIVSFFTGLATRVQQIFEGLWIIIQAVWCVVSTVFDTLIVQPIANLISNLSSLISTVANTVWGIIKGIWGIVAGVFTTYVATPISNIVTTLSKTIKTILSTLWNGIKSVMSTAANIVSSYVVTPIEKAFNLLWKAISAGVVGAMNSVIARIESTINWIIDGVNNIIGKFNTVVSFAAKITGSNWGGVDLVPGIKIPRFADGGFPETGELFMARENGLNELVGRIGNHHAVANNDQIVAGITSGVYQANEEQNALLREQNSLLRQLLEKDMSVNLGDRDIARANVRGQRAMGLTLRTT